MKYMQVTKSNLLKQESLCNDRVEPPAAFLTAWNFQMVPNGLFEKKI